MADTTSLAEHLGEHRAPAASDDPSARGRSTESGKDPLLDLIRITAIGRVVLWHTWSWAWLTWIPAMPAMFFVTGALLEGSLARRGWLATLRPRLQRLLVPYWVYAAACWAVMLLDGWRPTVGDALRWAVPLADPVGSDRFPGLWIPLWYLRAYLWFLLASGLIRVVRRRLGNVSVLLSAAAAVGVWWWARQGADVPLAVGDAVTYLPFVLAGMGYGASRRVPSRAVLLALGATSAVAAVLTWRRLGPEDGVVNRSYLLTMLVGLAGVALVFAFRATVLSVTSSHRAAIARVNSRALTIYLWQGFGLVAAQRLVDERLDPGPLRAVLSLAVVVGVIGGAVALFGFVEDRAAGRAPAGGLTLRRSAAMVPAAALVVAALAVDVAPDAPVRAPLSGRAVVARGGLIEQDLAERLPRADVSGMTPQQVLDQWVDQHADLLDRIGTGWIDGAIAAPDGSLTYVSWNPGGEELAETIAWWSMTKTLTAAWLVRLVDDGVVALDDPVGRYVPEVPRAGDMTLEQLARHTSGIPQDLDGDLFDANPADEIDRFIERGELAYEPGEGYGYSRVGYFVLALALERASGTTWESSMRAMAEEAGVAIGLDDDWWEDRPVSDPDRHGYRGGLWSSGGVVSGLADAVGLLRWLFTEGLSERAVDSMTRFPADGDRHYYGLALVPMCPCEMDGGWIRSERFGLDTATGSFAVDGATGATVMLRPESWWDGTDPATEFYDLQQRLLDSVS